MMSGTTRRSPSPSVLRHALDRRTLLKGAAGAAALGLVLPSGRALAEVKPGTATGNLTVGSNHSDKLDKPGVQAMIGAFPNKNVKVTINTTDHNTFQQNITTYLQNPDDMMAWFSGYRMRYFAAQGLVGDISDVWAAGLNDSLGAGFKTASTGDDGKQYFVPTTYYIWGIHYRPSIFAANGWTPPKTKDELMSLASNMKDKGLIPFAFANDGNWPAMGTFDQLNFRMNGYKFHVDLMAGKEKWTDDRVKAVFTEWQTLLPFQQENPNGRKWQEGADALVSKQAGMMTLGTFIGQQFPNGDASDLDFFSFPEYNKEFGTDTVEAPLDGWMMASKPKNAAAAKELLQFLGTAPAQTAYLKVDNTVVVAPPGVDASIYNPLQKKVAAAVSSAKTVTQFLDRDTSPEFASNVAGQALADFLANPSKIDGILKDMQTQAEAILGS